MSKSPHKFILSGGGTGGHIFPAVAIADAIRQREPEAEILFVGALGRMEMDKVPAAGYPIEGLWISGLQRSLTLKNLSFPLKVISSTLKARKLVKDYAPDVVIGTGGYASGPTLRAAASLGYPCLIQEQNSFPGITNKLLSKKVQRICVAYEGLEKWFPKEKIIITGNPVRKDILGFSNNKSEAEGYFKLDPSKKTLLVIGGSLGALTINESVKNSLPLLQQNNLQLIWQTGKTYYDAACQYVQEKGTDVHVFPFINRMDLAYAAADIIVSRAGAIAISELCIIGKPCLLVPSPNVAEDHQTKNARALSDRNAAVLLPDIEAREKLGEKIMEIMGQENTRALLSESISLMAHRDATERITDAVFELIRK
jgi:UDP-N-acetylglucosamine--N-acetylmuramyl-(pentapeptide) pyrophosphoryl-undecaprenol N-acetylglucosamine transferase